MKVTNATLVVASLGSLHCDLGTPVTATISLRADMPGASTACFRMEISDPGGGAATTIEALCGAVDDQGVFTAEEQLACAPDEAGKRVVLSFVGARTDSRGIWADPCGVAGCALDLTCGAATDLDLVMANEETYADWTATTVAIRDGWFGARVGTVVRPATPDGSGFSYLAVAFAGSTFGETHLNLSQPQIACANGTTCTVPIIADAARVESTCSDGTVIMSRTYLTEIEDDSLDERSGRHANLIVDLAGLLASGSPECTFSLTAAVSDGPLTVGPHATYPVASYHARFTDAGGELEKLNVSFDDYGEEDASQLSIGHLRGEALRPASGDWGDAPATLCHESSAGGLTTSCQ